MAITEPHSATDSELRATQKTLPQQMQLNGLLLLRRLSTLLVIIFGWVIFRSDNIAAAGAYIQTMLIPITLTRPYEIDTVLHLRNISFFMIGCIATIGARHIPSFERLAEKPGTLRIIVEMSILIAMLPYCSAYILGGSDNPFIYFKF